MRYVAARNLWISGNLLSNIAERILRKKEGRLKTWFQVFQTTFCLIKSLQYIARCESAVNQRTFVFTGNDAFERALFGDAEDDDVEFAFAAEGEGGRVHDFEVFV